MKAPRGLRRGYPIGRHSPDIQRSQLRGSYGWWPPEGNVLSIDAPEANTLVEVRGRRWVVSEVDAPPGAGARS
jgi:hypothetical protein